MAQLKCVKCGKTVHKPATYAFPGEPCARLMCNGHMVVKGASPVRKRHWERAKKEQKRQQNRRQI